MGLQGLTDEGTTDLELVSKLNSSFSKIGVSLADSSGELRSSYDILYDLSNIWGTLDKNTKVYIAELVAGKNQVDVFNALLSNFNNAVAANETAINSAGSAAKENARYMESLEAKVQALKQTFQDLSTSLISSDLVKTILDLANAFLKLIDTPVGKIVAIATGISAVSVAVTSLWKVLKLGEAFSAVFTTGTTLAAGGLAALNLPLLGVIAGLSALIVLYPKIHEMFETANASIPELNEKLSDTNAQLQSNKERIEEINNLPWTEKTSEILAEKDALSQENEELQKQIEKLDKLKTKKVDKTVNRTTDIYLGEVFATSNIQTQNGQAAQFDSYKEALDALIEKYGVATVYGQHLEDNIYKTGKTAQATGSAIDTSLTKIYSQLTEELVSTNKLTDDSILLRDKNIETIKEQVGAYEELVAQGGTLNKSQQQLVDTYYKFLSALDDTTSRIPNYVNGLIAEAEQSGATGRAIFDLVQKQILLNKTNLDVSQQIEALLQMATAAGVAAEQLILAREAAKGDSRAGQAIVARYGSIGNYFSSKLDTVGWTSTSNKLTGGSTKTKGAEKQKTDKALATFQTYYKNLQHLRDTDQIKQEEYYGQLAWWVRWYTKTATANMKAYGTNAMTIQQNMYQYEEEIYKWRKDASESLKEKQKKDAEEAAEAQKKALEEQQSLYEKFFSYMTDKITEEIEALQEEYDKVGKEWDAKIKALTDQNDALQDQIALEEKLNNLAKAKDKKVYVYKDGRFQYVQDIEAINQAQSDLESYQRDQALKQDVANLESLKAQALKSIQDQIDGWEKYKKEWSSVVTDYQKEQDRLMLEQKLGISLEGDNWKNRLNNLSDYVTQYKNLLGEITKAQALTNQQLQEVKPSKGPYGGYNTIEEMNEALARGETVGDEGLHMDSDNYYGTSKDDVGSQPSGAGTGQGPSASDIWNNTPGWDLVGFAGGTKNAPAGISLVGEEGAELRVLNQGDGIIPSKITENLWTWGMTTPQNLLNGLNQRDNNNSGGTVISISNLNLPNVSDAPSFVTGMKNLAIQYASKRK